MMMMTLLLTMLSYTLLTSVLCMALVILLRFIRWLWSPLRQLPGPKNRGYLLGNTRELLKEPYMTPQTRWWKQAGINVPMIHYNSLFYTQTLIILDKKILQHILTKPHFERRIHFIKNIFGKNVLTLNGTHHKRHRKLLQPAFGPSFLKQALNKAVPPLVQRITDCWKRAANETWEIDVASHMSALTLDILGQVGFAHDFHALDALGKWALFQQTGNQQVDIASVGDPLLQYFINNIGPNILTMLCILMDMPKLDRFINPSIQRKRQLYDKQVEKIVAQAQQQQQQNNDTTPQQANSNDNKPLLHIMLQARDEAKFSDAEVRDNVKIFMLAGHETTSTWCYWAFFALATYPDVQERLYQEVIQHAGRQKANDNDEQSTIQMQHVEQMDYLGAFLQEVLRLYPPIGAYVRHTTQWEEWHGIKVPPATKLVLPQYILHRHPKYWDDPDTFRPERWINVSPEEQERRRFCFFPFSLGGRYCIGKEMATMEIQLILAPLIRQFRFATAPSQRDVDFHMTSRVTTKTNPSFKIVVQERS